MSYYEQVVLKENRRQLRRRAVAIGILGCLCVTLVGGVILIAVLEPLAGAVIVGGGAAGIATGWALNQL